jgi:hypothetical protein
MSYEYDSEYDSEDEHNMEQIIQEVDKDDNETDFSFWMSEQGLNMPIESWASSSRPLVNVLENVKIHPERLEKLKEATEYYVAVYGGNLHNVLAEMIHTFSK